MKKTAVIVHLNGLPSVTPLVGGYLKAYALADPMVARDWQIELYSKSCRVKASLVIRYLVDLAPDLVAFSVYTWNAGLVRRLLPTLRGLLPSTTQFLLGGTEVMNMAPHFVEETWGNVAVCNGEGEQTFREYLLEFGQENPRLENIEGITFRRGDEWHTTQGQARIQNLTELPSPWLSGAFDDVSLGDVALFETNRGCPFFCEFCFWGGATGQKVYSQDLERLKEELTYIAARGVRTLNICDANFGILERDVALADHIVAVSKKYRGLSRIVFNSSKSKPERVEQISQIFGDAGLLTRHVFSLQSMEESVLKIAKRRSLERETYVEIQRRLNERNLASIIELIWPMPGETLESFKRGVDDLCGLAAQGFLIYPLLWLNNTGYSEKTEEYGITLLPEDDSAGAALIVVETREVSFNEYLGGLGFSLALHVLHNCRGLYCTLQLLNALGIARFRDVLDAFAKWMTGQATGPLAAIWSTELECFEDIVKFSHLGIISYAMLCGQRGEFDALLVEFAASQSDWFEGEHAKLIREAVEYDLLCRPYVFLQTPMELGVELQEMQFLGLRSRSWRATSAFDFPRMIHKLRRGEALTKIDLETGKFTLKINHRTNQLFLFPSKTTEERNWLCAFSVQEVARIEPKCSLEVSVQAAPNLE